MVDRVIATVDIGTNTLKYAVFLETSEHRYSLADSWADTVRLGAGLESAGVISPIRADLALASLEAGDLRAREHGATVYLAVATEAFRRAANGAEILRRVARRTNWRPRIVSGADEAALTFVGLRDQLPEIGNVVIVDIGGGSTEIIVVVDRRMVTNASIPIGSTVMADRWFIATPPGYDAVSSVAADASAVLLESMEHQLESGPSALILSGGNGVFLHRLVARLGLEARLAAGDFGAILEAVATLDTDVIAAWLAIPHERAGVLPAGAGIASAVSALCRPQTVRVAPGGIRNGLFVSWLENEGVSPMEITIDVGTGIVE